MNYYTYLRLDELGISSDEEAEELEYELELRFEDFTPKDRKTWLQQNAYLDHFSRIGTVSSAAREAGVTIFTAQRWKRDNVFGLVRRHEVATLIFNDSLKERALLRASDPKAPATLLIELLRAYIPEEFSRNGHKCDSSKSDEILRRFRENARREKEAGRPNFRKMAEGAENAYPPDDSEPSYSHPSPAGGEIQRGGSPHPTPYGHEPSSPNHPGGGRYPEDVSAPSYGPDQDNHNPSAPSALSAVNPVMPKRRSPPERRVPPTRAERREQLRQQRKAEKKNTFPVKRF